ncbi:RNA-directed DNA polymerase from mobile element jockey [Eumeta japonica]|uniref:RNA-directed DNA polymerase from mobile element jockey n=1 Tax=Eumeta variegata TaxID=151549 RepID=A0A4C1URG9_EUMVA|nr:RNA-directed DNA polymerase from mobile element jockey [Eumeta japonica]
MKGGKATGYDRVSSEMLRSGGGLEASLLYQLFNKFWKSLRVPNYWCKAIIVPFYKGKTLRQVCANYRPINLLNVVGKLDAKSIIERVVNEAGNKISDVQTGFRNGMGCTDQILCLRNIAEKFLASGQKGFCIFVDPEKAYDRVKKNDL